MYWIKSYYSCVTKKKNYRLQGQKYKPTSSETSQVFCVLSVVYYMEVSRKEFASSQHAKIFIIHTKWQLKGDTEY